MKRRDVLKILPVSLAASAAGLSHASSAILGRRPKNWTRSASIGLPLHAEVKPHNGRPALFLNGRPEFAAIYWVPAPKPDSPWEFAEQAKSVSRTAGIHIYAFDVGKGTEWIGPRPGRSDPYDFSTLEARFSRILDVDPDALFHLRIHLEIGHGDWWEKLYPRECEILSTGARNGQSFASRVWREQAKDFLRAYAAELGRTGFINHILAFQVGAGHTGEWVKGESSMYSPCGDYSEPMRQHFREWLRKRYNDDDAELRAAWSNSTITFETAVVPEACRQLEAKRYIFRDPKLEQDVIDYFRCLAELCADAVTDFCRTVKEATSSSKLAGAFFGYLLDLAWNGGFFKERPDSDYSTYQRSGHLGLRRVLESPDVDFLVSPYSYGFRGIGGEAPSMLPAESVSLHGKLLLIEDDTRTHADPADTNYGRVSTLTESVSILKRNFAQALTHGQGMWWASWKVDTVKEPAFLPLLQRFKALGTFALSLDLTPRAEVAVLLDDESFFYETCRYNLDIPLIFQQRLWGLPRMGAPFNIYLLDDFLAGKLAPHMLYIFLNSFRLGSDRREALKRELRREKRVALWIYAPGYIRDDPSLEHMRDLTGFSFEMGEQPWGPLLHITEFNHPLTAGLTQDLNWGTNNKLAPLFYVDDPDVKVLGQVVFSQGNCKCGYAVKSFTDWTSIYIAAPNIPAPVLRRIARFAGAHIYSEDGDVLYATPELLGVHTVAGGKRTFKLPQRVEVVYDLFEQKTCATKTNEFQVALAPSSAALFFTGSAQTLSLLQK